MSKNNLEAPTRIISAFRRTMPSVVPVLMLAFNAGGAAQSRGSSAAPKAANPSLRVVAVVGCVTSEGTNWLLTQASGPITMPTSDGKAETGSGVTYAMARKQPLGTGRYRLMNMITELGVPQHKGQRVLAKGLLLGDDKDRRVNLVAFEEIAPTCTADSR